MNKLWHAQNKMPPRATLEQRIEWHKEHQIHCACREAPKNLLLRSQKITDRPQACSNAESANG
jgi:hypothetical protein